MSEVSILVVLSEVYPQVNGWNGEAQSFCDGVDVLACLLAKPSEARMSQTVSRELRLAMHALPVIESDRQWYHLLTPAMKWLVYHKTR